MKYYAYFAFLLNNNAPGYLRSGKGVDAPSSEAGQLRPVHLEIDGNPSHVATGDLNNDGHTDLVTANNNAGTGEVSVFLQREK